jgi:nitrous oxide reductase
MVVALIGASATTIFYLASKGRTTTSTTALGGECVKPANGFLVVASSRGYNDSIDHGVPKNSWPIITVEQGQTVNIAVCNTDFQAHGFQISYYYASSIITVVPGQVLHISFVADKAGEFRIYCNIFCSIHFLMQNGLLNVTSA